MHVKRKSWSVFVFGYNEQAAIPAVIRETVTLLREIASEFSVMVIDDGSTDGTGSAVEEVAREHPEIQVIRHPVNLGIGPTLADGFRVCDKEIVCGIPADGEFDVTCLRAGARALEDADIVCFWRDDRKRPFLRRLLTRSHRVLNHLLLGLKVRDVNWVKIYRRSVLVGLPARSHSPLLETEQLAMAKHLGAKIVELPSPVRLRERPGGAGWSGTLRNGLRMTCDLLLFALRFRLGRRFARS